MFNTIKNLLIPVLSLVIIISACTAETSNPAPSAVIGYFVALVAKDENGMINYSCAAWEEQARLEFNSFAAVEENLVLALRAGPPAAPSRRGSATPMNSFRSRMTS